MQLERSGISQRFFVFFVTCCAAIFAIGSFAASREVHLHRDPNDLLIQVEGDEDDDWFIQASADLTNWVTITNLGTVLSNPTNAPVRSIGFSSEVPLFYRALRTQGLFDTNLMRTISLTFTNSNWQTLLSNGRMNGSNTPATLIMSNGTFVLAAGARYKGNTSFDLGGAKKSVNLEIDFRDPEARLMGHKTVNLNNAAGDETIMREAIYFNTMAQYAPSPEGAMAKLVINNTNWGVYSFVSQENNDLIKKYFPSDNGDRWRTPNNPNPSATTAFGYLGATTNLYRQHYDLRSNNSTNAWDRLLNAIIVLNQTPADIYRDKVEEAFAVDSWLWFLAIENVFADDDSYWNKGSDYSFYYEVESGRIHPLQHDGNEAFVVQDVSLSPVQGSLLTTRPLLYKLLAVPELRQRYLAHMRTVIAEQFHPSIMTRTIDHYHRLSVAEITVDPKKNFTMSTYTNELRSLKTWITNRYNFLTNHVELRPLAPSIVAVYDPTNRPTPTEVPIVTAQVAPAGTNGISSVWLYWRDKTYGIFSRNQMFDDGVHGDGAAGDGVFGGVTTNYPAGHKIHYYIEARSANLAKAASFAPANAEVDTFSYRVGLVSAETTPVVINEVMSSNTRTIADPQGEFDDWIELRNLTASEVDMTGRYLSVEPNNPSKWQFPVGTKIPANGYIIVWADEDGLATEGLHCSFKLSAEGEAIFLTDTDANQNAVLDSLDYEVQEPDRSFGRPAANPEEFVVMDPTPGTDNE
ncbi:MAG TPA: CotH kinase family protein [Candidatus Kapabacteria bacterium]|nr:CotH kinase family protein [Candidatus Kapabacteria bacterium]